MKQEPHLDKEKSRAKATLDHALDEAAANLHRMGQRLNELDSTSPSLLQPEWSAFVKLLQASAVVATDDGEAPADWAVRSARRWGTPNTVQGILADLQDAGSRRRMQAVVAELIGASADPLSRDPRTDIPSLAPQIAVPAWAGISGVDLALTMPESKVRVTAASVDVSVRLGKHERGAHMSRMQQSITASEAINFATPLEAAIWIAQNARDRQYATAARATIRATLKQRRTARFSGEESSIVVSVVAKAEAATNEPTTASMSVEVGVMTACPCTLRFSQLKAERITGISSALLPPTFTHSQPGLLTVTVAGTTEILPSWDLVVEALDGVAHFREAVLKRQDEHELVERTHRRPQFTEDLTRLALVAVAARVHGDVYLHAEAILSESIHPHSASASAEALAAELWEVQE
jgi:GTP cyclohydrolase FolE2